MKRQLSLVLAITATLALAACQKQEAAPPAADAAAPAASAPAAEPAPAAEAAPAATAAMAPAATVATAAPAAGESLGVPECDDYLTKYEACISSHVPAASQDALKQSLAATRAGWKQAIDAGGKSSLAAACKTMTDTARTSMKAYGCTDF